MKVIELNPHNQRLVVELTEPEKVLKEWFDSLLDDGYGPNTAVERILMAVPIDGSAWHLLANGDFRSWLTVDHTEDHAQKRIEERRAYVRGSSPVAVNLQVLREIQKRDPDGQSETEPTQADHDQFERWVRATYGADAWKVYNEGGWEPTDNS